MCGINGFVSDRAMGKEAMRDRIGAMTERLRHRGPDESGYFVGERVALGHRRLSIIDLESGQQPISSEDGSKRIIFNGEIYNYKDIQSELVARGHVFSTQSDTETILHAYEEWGEGCFGKLRGMFAFCIWDSRDEVLLLARDRVGKKPVFYTQSNGTFLFASEMKSILEYPGVERRINDEALASYFTYSYIPAPWTIFEGIHKLLPGHYLVFRKGAIQVKEYWDIEFAPDRTMKEKDCIHDFMALLDDAVRVRLMSEVPLGAFLSGGIDSSTVVALMSRASEAPAKTFSIGFGGSTGGFDDERKYARLVASRYATEHREYEVVPHVEGLLEKIVRSFDEPFGDDSTIPSYYVCKMARENVTVALSGLGGDEVFAGYERYLGFHLSHIYQRIPKYFRDHLLQRLINRLPESSSGGYTVNHIKRFARSTSGDDAKRYFGFVSKIQDSYQDSFFNGNRRRYADSFASAENFFRKTYDSAKADDPLNKVFYCDMKTYLCEDILALTDRLSMHHSLEVRVPFLDHHLLEYCAKIPPEWKIKWFRKKYLLKKGVDGLLPREVLNHKKQGFVGPMTHWLRTELKGMTLKTLSRENLSRHDIFNYNTVQRILDDHYCGKEINDTLIWSLIIFQVWFNCYMDPGSGS